LFAAADDSALLALKRKTQRRELAKRDQIGRAEHCDDRENDALVAPPVARATVDARKKTRIVCEPRSELGRPVIGDRDTGHQNPLKLPRKWIRVVPALSTIILRCHPPGKIISVYH
jgi:hypothetical protein